MVNDKVEFKEKDYEKLLYRKILTNRLELLTCINIVLFILPVVFYKFHRFSEHFHRANSGWIRCLQLIPQILQYCPFSIQNKN